VVKTFAHPMVYFPFLVVANSLGPSATQFPMVVALGFLFPSLATKYASLAFGGMTPLVGVPSLPFG